MRIKQYICLAIALWLEVGYLLAQSYYVPTGYVGYYDYDHRIIERQWVLCEEDDQDLWNGCFVQMDDEFVRVVDGENVIIEAQQIYLLPKGNYCVTHDEGETWCICDKQGKQMFCADDVETLWNGCYNVKLNRRWHLFDETGKDTGFLSNELFMLYSNGYYQYVSEGQFRVLTPKFKDIGICGDEITLRNDNSFRVRTASGIDFYTLSGHKIALH